MRREVAVLVAAVAGAVPPRGAAAQATGMPSYNAPYRAFQRSELGGVFSFPEGGGTAFEGVYRYASGKFDIGLRWRASTPASTTVLRSEEHTSELQSQSNLVCRLLLEKKNEEAR